MPLTPSISFACPQCAKKFSAPASAAGKSVMCKCGAQVMVSAAQSTQPFVPPTYTPQPAAPIIAPTTPATNLGSQPFPSFGLGGSSASGLASRRSFPALDAAAKVFTILAWLYVVFGAIAAVILLLTALASGQPEAIGAGIGGCIGLALVVGLAFIFIRAVAEMIRLTLYIAELLEDIRAK